MKLLYKVSKYINVFSISCGNFFIILGLVLIFMEVVLRYVFHFGFRWVEELTCYLFIYVTLLGASAVSKNNEQMKIDVFKELLPPRFHYLINIVFSIFILFFLGIISYEGINFFKVGLSAKSPALQINLGIPYLAIPLGSIFIFVQEFKNFLKNLREK